MVISSVKLVKATAFALVFSLSSPVSAQSQFAQSVELAGKWFGVLACGNNTNATIFKIEANISRTGSGYASEWKYSGHSGYTWGNNPPGGMVNVRLNEANRSVRFQAGRRGKPWVGTAIGRNDTLVLTSSICSDLVLSRDKKVRNGLVKAAKKARKNQGAMVAVNAYAQPYHGATALGLISRDINQKDFPKYLVKKASPKVKTAYDSWVLNKRKAEATQRFAARYQSLTRNGLSSLSDYWRVDEHLYGPARTRELINPATVSELRKHYALQVDRGFAPVANSEVAKFAAYKNIPKVKTISNRINAIASRGSSPGMASVQSRVRTQVSYLERQAKRDADRAQLIRKLGKNIGDLNRARMKIKSIDGWGFSASSENRILKNLKIMGQPSQMQMSCTGGGYDTITFKVVIESEKWAIDNRIEVISDGAKRSYAFRHDTGYNSYYSNTRLAEFTKVRAQKNARSRNPSFIDAITGGGLSAVMDTSRIEVVPARKAKSLKIYTYAVSGNQRKRVYLTDLGKDREFSLDDFALMCGYID